MEAERIQNAVSGSETAWRELVEEHLPAAQRFFLRLTGGHQAEADELAQRAFIKVYRNLARFRGDCSLRTWLYRIWTNIGRDWLRSCKREPAGYRSGGDEMFPHMAGSDRTDRRAVAREDLARVQAAMEELPDRERMVLHLHVYEGADYGEIAEILDIARNTVKVHIFHARRKLLTILEGPSEKKPDETSASRVKV